MRQIGLHALFFLSGVSALVYEIVWQRQLNLIFGVSTLSVATVLAAFMGGLALGGLLFGQWADRARRPLRFYAFLEIGIGIGALVLPSLFAGLTDVYVDLSRHFQPGPVGGACLRFAIAFPVLAGLATLLGGTLPLMGRLSLGRNQSLSSTFSLLYAVNTLGAVVGAALTGFILLRWIGMSETLYLAASVNFLVAAAAAVADVFAGHEEALPIAQQAPLVEKSTPVSGIGPCLALGCAALTGAVSMGYEVAWARILGILTSNSAYGFSMMLTVLLLGISLGGLVQWAWSRRPGDPWKRFTLCQVLLAAITLVSLPYFRTSPPWLERWSDGQSTTAVFLGEFALTGLALFVPGLLMGMSLPLLVAGVTGEPGRFGRSLGHLYAINNLGCVLGAFVGGFILIPWLGIHHTMGVLLGGSLLAGLVAWFVATRPALPWRLLGAGAAVLLAGISWWFLPNGAFHKSVIDEPRRLLYYQEGNNGTVAVVEEVDGSRSIMVDGQPVAGTLGTSVIDQKMLAHLPLLLHPDPRRALTVGFGSGGTSASMLLHGIEVDCVEIEKMVPAAANLFESENHGVLARSGYRLILDDARSWLRVTPDRYDAIVTDCTNIQYRSNGDLYTVEYFQLMKNALAPDGLAAAWVPANGIREKDLKTLLRSFREIFPHTSVWYMNTLPTDFLIVVGTPYALSINLSRLAARMQDPEVHADLEAVGLADPYRLIHTLLIPEQQMAEYLGTGPLNTDDHPVLSYSTYGASFEKTIVANLLDLMAFRVDVSSFVEHPGSSDMMLRHYVVSNELLLGHLEHWAGAEAKALSHYVKSAQLLPHDAASRELVLSTYMKLRSRRRSRNGPSQSGN